MTSIAPNTATASPPPPPPVPYDLDAIKKKVQKAKSLLYLDHPFFGAAASKRPIIYTDRTGSQPINTAAMSATGQMYMNPSFAMGLSTREMMFLLAHEAMHYMLCHSLRRGTRDAEAWNIACDLVINDTLIFENVGDFIKGGLTFDGARDMASEALYADPPEGYNGGNGGIGNDVLDPVGDDGRPLDESEIRRIEAEAKVEGIQAAKAAKARGKLSAGLKRMIDEIVNIKIPYDVLLERYMVAKIRNNKTWSTPKRKYISQNIYLKGKSSLPKMGTMVLTIDTSCSVNETELAIYEGHANRVIETCQPERVVVIYCDSEVKHVEEFTADDYPVRLDFHGGGGTEFKPAFDYIDDHNIDPDVVVYLTDGHGDQDEFTTHHETVWITTDCEDFPWGTVIKHTNQA